MKNLGGFAPLFLLSLLCAVPVWLIPIAPLSDWPVHLAIANEASLIGNGMQHQFYFVDYSFAGYTSLQWLLMFLLQFVGIELAGKIALTLLFIITPFCWQLFFKVMSPEKEQWLFFGMLLNYSVFFYFGMINFLFAVHLSVVFIALFVMWVRQNSFFIAAATIALGGLVFFTHVYQFLLAAFACGAYFLWVLRDSRKPASFMPAIAIFLMVSYASFTILTNDVAMLNQEFYKQSASCTALKYISSQPDQFNPKGFLNEGLSYAERALPSLNPAYIFASVFPSGILLLLVVLAAIGLAANFAFIPKKNRMEIMSKITMVGKSIGVDWVYLSLSVLFILHFVILPDCPARICMMNSKSLPLAFAFLLVGIKLPQKTVEFISLIALLFVLLNVAYQSYAFVSHVPAQAAILQKLDAAAEKLPTGAAVFVEPAAWNTFRPNDLFFPPFKNPHYHAYLLLKRPDIYVSALFLHQNTFILRSSLGVYDDMATLLPSPSSLNYDISGCFADPPKKYGWIIGQDMQAAQNS